MLQNTKPVSMATVSEHFSGQRGLNFGQILTFIYGKPSSEHVAKICIIKYYQYLIFEALCRPFWIFFQTQNYYIVPPRLGNATFDIYAYIFLNGDVQGVNLAHYCFIWLKSRFWRLPSKPHYSLNTLIWNTVQPHILSYTITVLLAWLNDWFVKMSF